MCRILLAAPKKNPDINYDDVGIDLIPVVLNILKHNVVSGNADGFGMFLSGTEKIWKSYKSFSDCLVPDEDFIDFLWESWSEYDSILAHVRAATIGKGQKKSENSHPFINGRYVLVHNGHLSNADEVKKKFGIDESVVVDSEIFLRVFSIFNAGGITAERWQSTLDEFIGPMVIVVYDKETGIYWIAVGKERTLNLYQDDSVWIFNTDPTILDLVKHNLFGLSVITRTLSDVTMTKLTQDTLYTFNPNESNAFVRIGDIKTKLPPEKKYQPQPWGASVWQGAAKPKKGDETGVLSMPGLLALINQRIKSLERLGIDEEVAQHVIDCLYPLLPSSLFSFSEKDSEIFFGFMDSVKLARPSLFEPTELRVKTVIWQSIKSKMENIGSPAMGVVLVQYNRDYIEPFFMNSVETLKSIEQEIP